jgi:SagB-type dehydrogenase family enzyme
MTKIALPEPALGSQCTFEQNLLRRRSVRAFAPAILPLAVVSQLLWAAQGITSDEGLSTAPSAGALYPLELYLAAGNVAGVAAGVYRYSPGSHELRSHLGGDLRGKLADAALGQSFVADGAAVLIIAAVYSRTAAKYGSRANRYVHMEAGHAAQNVYLQAQFLRLGTVLVGAFDDDVVRDVLELSEDEAPLALMPLGRPR